MKSIQNMPTIINFSKYVSFLMLLLFFQAGSLVFAQQEEITLQVEWMEAQTSQLDGKTFVIPRIKNQGYENNVPNFYWTKKVDFNSSYSFELIRYETADCPQADKDFIALNNLEIPSVFEPSLVTRNAGSEAFAVVNFLPYINVNGSIKRITSLKTVLNVVGKKPAIVPSKSFTTQSVLREGTGTWYKISVTDDGIYKIDKAFLEACGISTSNLNPNHINIFGNGEGMLPESNSIYRTDDLAKNAIQIVGDGDGSFDDGDYILFYAFGPNRWYANGLVDFSRQMNTYSNESFYFININSSETPLRIQNEASTTSTATHTVTEMDFRLIFEKEEVNLVKGGQRWYGDLFDVELSRTYNFTIPNVGTSPIRYRSAFAANSSGSGNTMTVSVNGTTVNSSNLPVSGGGDYARTSISFTSNPASTISLNLTVTRNNPKVLTYLDFITINARRSLTFYGSEMGFRDLSSVGAGNVSSFSITNFNANHFVWDITDRHAPKKVLGTLVGNSYDFRLATDTIKEFVASDGSTFKTPTRVGAVAFQNLHGLPQADYIIVSHPSFLAQANRLAALHESQGLSVHVVTEGQIFNEFSSGMRDATAIRYFMKMFYDRGQVTNDPPKYLLLFGDGTFDNRSKTTSENYIMTYQVLNSENHVAALVSDDYFGMLDNNESFSSSDLLDIGIGRLLISSTQIANEQVDKVEHYMKNGSNFFSTPGDCDCAPSKTTSTFGDWRLKYVQISDDPDTQINYEFVGSDCEPQVDAVEQYRQEMNVDKIYCDAYQQVSGAGGQRYPDVVNAINDRMRRGVLVVNYVGHGGETGVAEERIITVPQIQGWKNANGMPLLVSATCEFTKYDDPDRVSAGEWVSLNAKGGAIALMTTTRSVYINVNTDVALRFFENVYKRDADSLPRSFGEIIQETKNQTTISSDNKRSFTLIGDPALRIALPRINLKTDSIYREGTGNAYDTVRALDKMTLVGHVEDLNGNILSNFNGIVSPTIFDKPVTEYTLGQDPNAPIVTYQQQKNAIFKGQASVENGYFKISFIVPKDINFGIGNGKISLYGHNNVIDAMGYDKSVIIGGINPNGLNDDKGPDIELFMNEETFVSGGITDENPILIAKLFDENGINAVGSGIGHDITAIIDANSANPIILNEYYLADLNTYQSGVVNYNFSELAPGKHTLTLKAWDVNNNSSEATIEFVVEEKETPALSHVLNYPNPFTTSTQFFFEHNQVNAALESQIQVFTVSGKLVKTINTLVNTQGFRTEGIHWDGKDDFGDQLAKGVYVYRVSIKTDSGEMAEKLEKLVILR